MPFTHSFWEALPYRKMDNCDEDPRASQATNQIPFTTLRVLIRTIKAKNRPNDLSTHKRMIFRRELQAWAMKPFPGLVNFVPAVAYHFCRNLPAIFSLPGNGLIVQLYRRCDAELR